MGRLRPEKLHVRFDAATRPDGPAAPRRYTLTHSDSTGDLFLTVARDFDRRQISGLYTRFMRDEVLAEWQQSDSGQAELHVYCHVSGGLVFGSAAMRYAIFRRELSLVLECFRYGDRQLYRAHPELDEAPILVHYRSHRRRYRRSEKWGTPAEYRLAGA